MGKRVLVSLLAVALIFLASRSGTAQDAQEPTPEETAKAEPKGFQAGDFLTQEDFEHIKAALGCINLTPKDLEYNKVLRDDAYRLKVCDQSLNDPLGVPRTAEDAAKAFSSTSGPAERVKHAERLLDLPTETLSEDRLTSLEDSIAAAYEANDAEKAAELTEERDEYLYGKTYGGVPTPLINTKYRVANRWEPAFEYSRGLIGPAELVAQLGKEPLERDGLATFLPELFAESEVSLTSTPTELENGFEEGAKVTIDWTLLAGKRLSDSLRFWTELLAKFELDGLDEAGAPHEINGVTGGVFAAWEGPWGKFVIGGEGPNTYKGDDFIGIIDLGGDDTYKGRVACGIGLEGQAPISFVLDLAGDDRYLGEDFTQGFGFLGVGILQDLGGGDDVYKSRFCAQGCGLCGYGELYDDGGDDTYTTDSGSQGAGCFGYGQLTDKSGNDIYRGCRYTQGFAQVMGVGVLTDGAGNDLYYAGGKYLHQPLWNDRYQSLSQGFAIGNRYGETGGGVALLLDEGDGNDVYQADIYGQGSSYWYSLGMLVDTGGNDTYTLGQYGQGGGIHLSTGILVDLKGNDTYSNPYGVGLGGAHDWAVGWLIDRAGNDLYQGNGQGQGLNFAVGILMDCAGNDSHSTNNANSIGRGTNNDISLLLDFAGKDVYGPDDVVDGKFNRRGEHQIVYDVPEGWFPGLDESTLPTKQESVPESVTVQHILIAWDGTGVDTQKAKRTKAEAQALANDVLKLARKKGADWKQLQTDYNEDSGVDGDGAHNEYKATPDARLVKPFKDLALSLGVGQIDICESKFGFHIIKRIE